MKKKPDFKVMPQASRMENMRRIAKRQLGLHGKRKTKYRRMER